MALFDRIDAIPPLSSEERQLLHSVEALARDQMAPRAAAYDRSGEFPWDNLRAINAVGLNAIFLAEANGGAKEFRAERLLRDAKITQIRESTNQIRRQLIGRSFIGASEG